MTRLERAVFVSEKADLRVFFGGEGCVFSVFFVFFESIWPEKDEKRP